jgi:hypothetical protein
MNAPSPSQPQAKLVAFVSVFHLLRFFSGFFENREQLMLRKQETTLRKLKTVKKQRATSCNPKLWLLLWRNRRPQSIQGVEHSAGQRP